MRKPCVLLLFIACSAAFFSVMFTHEEEVYTVIAGYGEGEADYFPNNIKNRFDESCHTGNGT